MISMLNKILVVAATFWLLLINLPAGADNNPNSFAGFKGSPKQSPLQIIPLEELPPEAKITLERIKTGGPFPYARDGGTFANRERILPIRQRGYYREFTVPTPNLKSRGARRIISGNSNEYYYTSDHYRSFNRIQE